MWVVKIDKDGNEVWDKTYGGSEWDRADAVVSTSDGGYLLAGGTRSKGAGSRDMWVVKIDKDGNL